MDRHNYIVRVSMNAEEAMAFSNLQPLIGMCISEGEGNLIARLLGYEGARDLFKNGVSKNKFLKHAFLILGFLYLNRGDKPTFDDFFGRLIFTDKQVEKKVKRTFNIREKDETLSTTQLELMWLLNTDKDEWD
tara:strand:- start:56 stop:454 length:399 start_codon:yes stop_codon:yes gene_type:complete